MFSLRIYRKRSNIFLYENIDLVSFRLLIIEYVLMPFHLDCEAQLWNNMTSYLLDKMNDTTAVAAAIEEYQSIFENPMIHDRTYSNWIYDSNL